MKADLKLILLPDSIRKEHDMFKHSRVLMVSLLTLCCICQSVYSAAEINERISPAVRVFQENKDAVVNINTSQVVRERFGMYERDPIFNELFRIRPYERNVKRTSLGSGFIIHESGYIVTNAHVVDQADEVEVVFADGSELPAEILAADSRNDLAIIKVELPDGKVLQAVTLGTASDLMPGETTIAIGNPLGYQHTVTRGIVSAVNRSMQLTDDWEMKDLIQTDTPINPGNSGGPLFNVYGQLIGINTAIRGDAQNIGFAIPVDQLLKLLPELMNPLILGRVDAGGRFDESRRIQPPAEVTSTVRWLGRGGQEPVEINKMNGERVRNIVDAYVILHHHLTSRNMVLESTDGKNIRVALTPVTTKEGYQIGVRQWGAELITLTDALRERYRLGDLRGILVGRLDHEGAAVRSGIRTGDIIIQIGRHRIRDLSDYAVIMKYQKIDTTLDVIVIRNGRLGRTTIRR